jgi:hypothetical protein
MSRSPRHPTPETMAAARRALQLLAIGLAVRVPLTKSEVTSAQIEGDALTIETKTISHDLLPLLGMTHLTMQSHMRTTRTTDNTLETHTVDKQQSHLHTLAGHSVLCQTTVDSRAAKHYLDGSRAPEITHTQVRLR